MIEPEVTAGLGRRYMAFLIDSALVAATGLGVAFQQSTAFAVVGRDSEDKALVDPAQFEAMEGLLDFELLGRSEIFGFPVVRAQEFGNSVRVFGADSYRIGLIAAVVAALIVFGLIPALLQRTVGMMPFGLGIKKAEGGSAGIAAHLVRTIVGFVDAIPFVIPGALGFLTAITSPHRQRLGDRIAGTAVVDLRAYDLGEITTDPIDLGLVAAVEPDERDPVVLTGTPTTPFTATDLERPNAAASSASTSFADASPTPSGPTPVEAETVDTTTPTASTTTLRGEASDNTTPPAATSTFGDVLPPPPVHRKPPTEHPLGTPSDKAADAADAGGPTSSTADSTTAPDHDTTVEAGASSFETASEVEAPTATVGEHLTAQRELPLDLDAADVIETPDDAWQPPREEPAPVWQPAILETAPIESPNPHDGRTLDGVVLREPSVGALLSGAPTDDDASDEAHDRGGKHSKTAPTAKAPVWSDKWRAWMYWDTTKKCWLRHDTTSNTWQPIE